MEHGRDNASSVQGDGGASHGAKGDNSSQVASGKGMTAARARLIAARARAATPIASSVPSEGQGKGKGARARAMATSDRSGGKGKGSSTELASSDPSEGQARATATSGAEGDNGSDWEEVVAISSEGNESDKGGDTGASVNDTEAGSATADNGTGTAAGWPSPPDPPFGVLPEGVPGPQPGFKGASSDSSSGTKGKGKFIGHMTMDIDTWHGRHLREFMHEQGVHPGEFIAIPELTPEVMQAARLARQVLESEGIDIATEEGRALAVAMVDLLAFGQEDDMN